MDQARPVGVSILALFCVLVGLLAMATNMAIIAWLRQPGVRELFEK